MLRWPTKAPPPVGGWARIEAISRPRNKALSAELRRERRRIAEERMYAGRAEVGYVDLRLQPSVRLRRHASEACLRGQALKIAIPEVIDAWEFLHDWYRFVRGWRPMRLRTEPQRVATREWFEQWERLGAAVEPGRWGPDARR